MLRRILLITLLGVLTTLGAYAQMSDSQVIDFIIRESKAGASQSQIVTQLVQRGVQMEQIRRIQNQYNKGNVKGLVRGSNNGMSTSVNTLRRNNAPERSDNGNTPNNRLTISGNQSSTGKQNTSDKQNYPASIYDKQRKKGKQYTMGKQYGLDGNVVDDENDEETMDLTDTDEWDMQIIQNFDLVKASRKIFGHDIFNQRALSFEPYMNIATPQNYVLGPGDEVIIDIYGASQKTLQLVVSPEGTVTVPDYGPIQVGGLTVNVANSKIRRSLGARYRSSEVKLTVGQTRTILVNVMGEVRTPGTYTLSAFSTVFHALYMAGGISDLGTLRNIKVYRGGRLITIVDIYDYILNGRLTGNVRLQENDVVQVGVYDCLVDITGNIKRPMLYEMRKNESVGTIVKYAGGFTGDAYKKSVRLVRKTGEKHAVFTVDEFEMSAFKVDDGDSISVDAILDRYEHMVEVKGAVFRPGLYQLGQGVNSVRTLIQQADGVTEDAFIAHAVIQRIKSDRTLQVIPVDLQGIMQGSTADIPLQNEDVLFVPTQADRVSERTLTIGGEVFAPGVYEYADNTTIEDLILQAGGLTDAASTAKVDVSRRIVDPTATSSSKEIAKTYSFSLKDGLVVDGSPNFYLEPYDVVQVRRSPGFQTPRMITVMGEVMFEGEFALATKNQRLSDAIRAAGGVTDEAYVRGARLERRLNDDERARRDLLMQQLAMQVSGQDSIRLSQLQMSDTYTVGIHLDDALAQPGSDADIQLREGDRLVIPEYSGVVKISGNVMFPNTVAYQKGKDYKWYINQAGGFGDRAKKSATWIVYQNGTMSKVGRKVDIEPGCEIIVPTKNPSNGASLARWLTIGTSVTSMAAMVATLASALK